MKFSLICATLKRTDEVKRLLKSLVAQTISDFEIIFIDQNSDQRLLPLLERYSDILTIKRLISKPGLSKARNLGMESATGELIAFPDDDCWYKNNLLEQVARRFDRQTEIQGITGICFDDGIGKPYGRVSRNDGIITKNNVWLKGSSASMFVRRDFVREKDLRFDENLGLGSPNNSGEETDFLLSMLTAGGKLYYHRDIQVGHPYKKATMDQDMVIQGFKYGLGFGRVLAKHDYSLIYRLLVYLRSWIGMFTSILQLKFNWYNYHLNTFRGRRQGYHIYRNGS